jgi:ribulose-phosphate 3-epimerase
MLQFPRKSGRWKHALGRQISLAPSILSADFAHLAREIETVEMAGADILHLDVMDGHFVPNITIGPPVISSIRKITGMPLDAHLMIENPDRYIEDLVQAGVNWISVHIEADVHLNRTISFIHDHGLQAGIALNPSTSLCSLEEALPEADYVLIMTVNPGFGGQHFIPSTLRKIRKLRETIASKGYRARIEVDGGIGPGNLEEVLAAGAEIIVAGSAIFGRDKDASQAVHEMKEIAERHSRVLESI